MKQDSDSQAALAREAIMLEDRKYDQLRAEDDIPDFIERRKMPATESSKLGSVYIDFYGPKPLSPKALIEKYCKG